MLGWKGPQPCPKLLLSFLFFSLESDTYPQGEEPKHEHCGGLVSEYVSSADLQMRRLILSTFYQPAKLEVVRVLAWMARKCGLRPRALRKSLTSLPALVSLPVP